MGTRSGEVDPAIIGFLAEHENMTASEVVNMLNKSQRAGHIRASSDFRDLTARRLGHEQAALALKSLSTRSRNISAPTPRWAGGCHSLYRRHRRNNARLRTACVENLEFMGVKLDDSLKEARVFNTAVSAPDSPVKVLVIPTNEELVIASDTMRIVSAKYAYKT